MRRYDLEKSGYLYKYDSLPIELSSNSSNFFNETTLNSSQKFLIKNMGLVYYSKLPLYFSTKVNSLIHKKLKVLDKRVLTPRLTSVLDRGYKAGHISEIFFKKFLTINALSYKPFIMKFLYLRSLILGDRQIFSLLSRFNNLLDNKSINLVPSSSFNFKLNKSLISYNSKFFIKDNFTP